VISINQKRAKREKM
jgi:hypothetical protein